MTKNIQVIDGALNCTYDIWSTSDRDFALIFPDGRDIEFSDDLSNRLGTRRAIAVLRRLWANPIDKKAVVGIHGTLFYRQSYKKDYYPTRKSDEMIVPRDRPGGHVIGPSVEGSHPAVIATTNVRDQFERRSAVAAIGLGTRDAVVEAIIVQALRDPSEYVARAACEVVEKWALLAGRDAVVLLLRDKASLTRRAAIRTFLTIGTAADLPLLLQVFKVDKAQDVRREAAWVLWGTASAATWRSIFALFADDATPRHRVWACQLAERFGGPAERGILQRLADDPDGHVRTAAQRGLDALARRP